MSNYIFFFLAQKIAFSYSHMLQLQVHYKQNESQSCKLTLSIHDYYNQEIQLQQVNLKAMK